MEDETLPLHIHTHRHTDTHVHTHTHRGTKVSSLGELKESNKKMLCSVLLELVSRVTACLMRALKGVCVCVCVGRGRAGI